ncbi:MAG TPA: RNA polymerase sigma factor [Pirellulales bacterium]|nr:RNA polymerase sigma factor [Pirellulales bacterium]
MHSDDRPDEWLMGQVALGRRECLNVLLRRHAAGLMTFLERVTGHHHRSEELFQEAFLAVWTHSRSYQYPRPFKPWLFGIASKKCQADNRKRRFWSGREREEISMLPDGGTTPSEAAIRCENARLVAEALARVTPAQREVLVLRVWNHMSYTEIAAALDRSEATVRSHMFHGLANLRKFLEPRMQ